MRILVATSSITDLTIMSSHHQDIELRVQAWGPTATADVDGHTLTYAVCDRLFAEDAWPLLMETDKPDLVIIFHTGVVLQPQFMPGDILLVGRLVNDKNEELYAVDPDILNTVRSIARFWQERYPELDKILGRGPQIAMAPILSSAEIPSGEQERAQLSADLGVVAANAVISHYLSTVRDSQLQMIALLSPGCECNSDSCTHGDAGLLSFSHFCNDLVNNI